MPRRRPSWRRSATTSPPHAVGDVLGAFEKYLHTEDALPLLVTAGVLAESTGKKPDRTFVHQTYPDRLNVGTELSPREG